MNIFKIKNILVPVDFSGTGEKVLEQAALMAKKTGAEITLLYVLEGPFSNVEPNYLSVSIYNWEMHKAGIEKRAVEQINILEKQLKKLGAAKVNCITEIGTPYKEILAVAKRIKADIIIMGTHGVSGFREFVVGSNAFRVVSEATCPVLTVQIHTKDPGFKRILLPFRDKPHSREKVDYAIGIAKIYGATIDVLGISSDHAASSIKKIQLEAEQIKRIVESRDMKCTIEVVNRSYLAKNIFSYAEKKKSDLIVATSDLDKSRISEFVSGPVVQQIVNHSRIPVLSIRPLYNPNVLAASGTSVSDWTFWV